VLKLTGLFDQKREGRRQSSPPPGLAGDRISALAVRSAITLGINMKSSSPNTPDISKEARYLLFMLMPSVIADRTAKADILHALF
jgi:hypothetical protein